MKKYIYIIIAVASIFALSGCSNINDNQNTLQEMTFTAGFGDGVQTRATLDFSTKKVSFDAPDYIRIISASNQKSKTKKFTTNSGGASATFTGTAISGDPVYYAIYPYNSYDSWLELDGATIKYVHLSNDQSAAAEAAAAAESGCGWDKNAAIAYARADGSSLKFKHACALLKITNDDPNYVGPAVDFRIQASKNIAGTFNLNTESGELTSQSSSLDNNEIIVGLVPYNKTVYIAIPACTLDWFKVLYGAGSIWQYKQKSSVTFEAGKIYDLGKVSEIQWDGELW